MATAAFKGRESYDRQTMSGSTGPAQNAPASSASSEIRYVERKNDVLGGPAVICRVRTSKTGRSVYFRGRRLERVRGYKANYVDVETGQKYWVSSPKRRGADRLYSGVVHIDEDVREIYWRDIRGQPSRIREASYRTAGKYRR